MATSNTSAATDDHLKTVLRDATHRVLCDVPRWQDATTMLAHSGAYSASQLAHVEHDNFDQYHKASTSPASSEPTIKLGSLDRNLALDAQATLPQVKEEFMLCVLTTDIRMCEVCCEAKRKISRCGRCAHAFYCSAACQKKAWAGHKVFCGERVEAAKDLRTATVDGTINMHLYLRGVMRPDRPRLCRFWLSGLASVMESATANDARHALRPLAAFLWRYTWAAVPETLRPRLLAGVDRLEREAALGCLQGDFKATVLCAIGVRAILRLLDSDDAFVTWRELRGGQTGGESGTRANLNDAAKSPAQQRALWASMRGFVTSAIIDQDSTLWRDEDETLDPRTARLAICTLPRGDGLVSSAFGMLHCKDDVQTLLQRWLAPRQPGDAACLDLERHTLFAYEAGCIHEGTECDFPASPRRARRVPGHFIVRSCSALTCQGSTITSDSAAVEALAEMRAAGARALPLLPGSAPGEQERAFMDVIPACTEAPESEESGSDKMSATQRLWDRRRRWLVKQGGACALVGTWAEGVDVLVDRAPLCDVLL